MIDHEFGRVTAKNPAYELLPAKVMAAAIKPLTALPPKQEISGPEDMLQELENWTKETRKQLDEHLTTE